MNEKELIEYVEQLNIDIEVSNVTKSPHEKVKPYDIKKILEGYQRIKWKEIVKEFRNKYGCYDCLYFEKPKRCKAIKKCPLEVGEFPDDKVEEPKSCVKDKEGTCPYGKYAEACIGYCLKEIVDEFCKQKNKKEMEELKSGK